MAAMSAEFSACWVTTERNSASLQFDQVTRCRLVGGETVDYASDSAVPSILYTNLGTDLTGQCWYLTSASTSYVIINQFADGSAEIGFDTDPGSPGGLVAVGPTVPRCTSEPTAVTDPSGDAWDYATSYIHPPPTPDLNPAPGQGVTGLTTFIGVSVPSDHDASLTSGASSLDVEIVVSAVVVSWGDSTTDIYPPNQTILAGYPDGSATHMYEVKDSETSITVEYDWSARWRADGGEWTPLPVPNTGTTVSYPVAEIVSRLID